MVSPDYEAQVKTELYDFSTALDDLKNWKKITREWWNGKWMFLELQTPDEHSKMTLPYIYINIEDKSKIPDDWSDYSPVYNRVPWIASQTDILSSDWIIL